MGVSVCEMACFYPLSAWRAKWTNANGKRPVVFDISQSNLEALTLPCGQCIGCRLERSKQWAIRCVHEASLWPDNCFITLTYDDEHLPSDGSLNKRHFQLFMKRLRKAYPDARIRFYQCGEYGEQFGRPHYHACLFNFDFPDKTLWSKRDGIPLYHSESLSKIWGKGFASVGSVTFESAAYVARYIMKKVTGKLADTHYESVCQITGEITNKQPEYTNMSRKPGIGRYWYEDFSTDIYPSDFVVLKGKKLRPPRYYDNLYEVENPEKMAHLKTKRLNELSKHEANNTPQRLRVREQCQQAKLNMLKRTL